MTREAVVSLSPDMVIEIAKRYFSSAESGYSGTIVEEGETYVRFQTFRGLLAISAEREGEETRVRCSTLRYHSSIGKFILQLATQEPVPGV